MSQVFRSSSTSPQRKKRPPTVQSKQEVMRAQPSLQSIVKKLSSQHKIPAVPLQFQHLPVELLSKEFTKFNNPHKYRIHYLGPRPVNSFALHKKYGAIELQPFSFQPSCSRDYPKYEVKLRRIVLSSYINEGLRTNCHYKTAIFYRAFEGMNPTLNLKDEFIFDSSFQSGNLDCVIKPKPNVFDLFLRIDSNTRGHTQWYYFSVKNGKKGQSIRLNICNITKGRTLYEQGMRPYIFSRKKKQDLREKYSWQQGGQNINFEQKPLRYGLLYETIKVSRFYELGFDYTFERDNDQVFFAYSIPFTYSQLLHKISAMPSLMVRKETLGVSFTGVQIPILHITNFGSQSQRKQPKKNILVTGRIHPSESNSSHMVNGFVQFLLSSTKQAHQLRQRANFFIVPMMNPDGVIMGNTRTSAAGKDLNREFKSQRVQLYPEVFLIKSLAATLKKRHGLFMSLDFHGHSRKKNTFFYGPPYQLGETEHYKCRMFPKLVEKVNNSFRYYGCSFGISQQKKKTGRGVMFEQIRIPYTYTIESSIGLYYDFAEKTVTEFQEKAYVKMGADIGCGLAQFIVMEEEYESMMKERQLARQKGRDLKGNKQMKSSTLKQGQSNEKNEDFMIQSQQQLQSSMFWGLLQEIKQQCSKPSQFDADISSDDHDLNEDLQDNKLQQFNNLILQSMKKQSGLPRHKTFYEDKIIQDYSSLQLEYKSLAPTNLQDVKPSRKTLQPRNSPIKNTNTKSQKFRNRQMGVKFQSLKKTKPAVQKDSELLSSTRTQPPRKTQKDFVMANKQRYSITAKSFLINDQHRYEVIQLPKNIQTIRKQLTKGRILINSLFQSKTKTTSLRQIVESNNNLVEKYNFQLPKQRNISTSRFIRSQLKDTHEHSTLEQEIQLERRSSTNHFVRNNNLSTSTGKNIKLSPTRKKNVDTHQYEALNHFEIDNLAMTIKSFKGF